MEEMRIGRKGIEILLGEKEMFPEAEEQSSSMKSKKKESFAVS